MKMVYHNTLQKTEEYQSAFGGYNRTDNCSELEFYDMKNMTSDLFPILSPRKKRLALNLAGEKTKAIIAKDKLCHVADETFYIDNVPVQDLKVEPMYDESGAEIPIRLASMGAYVLIIPQKLYVNTIKPEEHGTVQKTLTLPAVMYLCDKDGHKIFDAGKYPEDTETGEEYGYYVGKNDAGEPILMKKVDENWIESEFYFGISNIYCKYFPQEFKEADYSIFPPGTNVVLSNFGELNLDGIKKVETILYGADSNDNYDVIVFKGYIPHNWNGKLGNGDQKISSVMPNMDYMVESGNRLWGCRYGLDLNGEFVNQIYASSLGDFTIWEDYKATASSSYSASVGSDGPFTAAARYDDKPIFFKENCFHRVYGSLPENYQIQLYHNDGVQKGSEKSIAVVENILFYKGVNGFYAYDGTVPQMISEKLGNERLYNAVGGACNQKYYASAKDKDGKSVLYAYDVWKSLWHKEDDTELIDCTDRGDDLFCLSKKGDFVISSFENDVENDLSWYAETGIIGKSTPDKKVVQRLKIRADLEPAAMVQVMIEYDSSGNYEPIFFMEGRLMQSYSIPIRIHRCDHFRILFMGRGPAKIYSLSKVLVKKGDR